MNYWKKRAILFIGLFSLVTNVSLGASDIKKLIIERRVMYDHKIDQRGYKWSGKSILKKISN